MSILYLLFLLLTVNPCKGEPDEQYQHKCEVWMGYMSEAVNLKLPVSAASLDQYVNYRLMNYSPKQAKQAVWKWINDYATNHAMLDKEQYCALVGQDNKACWKRYTLVTRYINLFFMYPPQGAHRK